MTDRQTQKDLSKKLASYKPSHYSRAFSIYQRHTLGKVDPILRAIALPCPLSARFPVYKTLRAIVKMLLLNEIELVIMTNVIKQSHWNIQDAIIIENEMGVGEMMCFSCDNNDYRQLTLYLLLVGWAAKSALNDDCQEILNEVRRVCFNFKSIFQQWANSYAGVLNLHPAVINRLYSHYLHPQASIKTDYQLMVDTVLQLSQAYNSQKDNTTSFSPPPTPKIPKTNEGKHKIFNFEASFIPVDFQKMTKAEQKKELQQEMNVFGEKDLTKSIGYGGILGSSFVGLFSLGSLNLSKRSDLNYCQVEFAQGEDNFMVFSKDDPTLSSVIGLRNMHSNTDKFLERDQDGQSEC